MARSLKVLVSRYLPAESVLKSVQSRVGRNTGGCKTRLVVVGMENNTVLNK